MSNANDLWRDMGVLAVEMEAAALYECCQSRKESTLHADIWIICYTGESLSTRPNQLGFSKMMEITGTGIMNNRVTVHR